MVVSVEEEVEGKGEEKRLRSLKKRTIKIKIQYKWHTVIFRANGPALRNPSENSMISPARSAGSSSTSQ